MVLRIRTRRTAVLALATTAVIALAGCSASSNGSGEGESVELTFGADAQATSQSLAKAQVAAFNALNPDITIKVSQAPDTGWAAPLANGVAPDLLVVDNCGPATNVALNGLQNFVELTDEDMLDTMPDYWKEAVADDGVINCVPTASNSPIGVFYSKPIYEELGLEVPHTWDEFFANAEEIKAAGYTPILQTYGSLFTSRIVLQGASAAQTYEDPTWITRFNDGGNASYDEGQLLAAIQAQQDFLNEGILNDDFASATNTDAFEALATGTAAMYPYYGSLIPGMASSFPDAIDDLGFFPIPDEDEDVDPLTLNLGFGVAINSSIASDSAKLAAAKKFLDFIVSPEGCEIIAAERLTGPFFQSDCELPDDVAPVYADMASYLDENAKVFFGEPLTASNFNDTISIMVEVGSGFITPEEAATKLDESARNFAQQSGLPGW